MSETGEAIRDGLICQGNTRWAPLAAAASSTATVATTEAAIMDQLNNLVMLFDAEKVKEPDISKENLHLPVLEKTSLSP